MTFSNNLIKYRKIKGYTQDDLAEKMGVSRQSVSKWENGESMPEVSKIVKIADYLEVSMDELFGREKIVKTEQNVVSMQDVKSGFKPNTILFMIICVFFLSLGGIVGYGIGSDKGNEKVVSGLENVEITGFGFGPNEWGGMNVEFVPSSYSQDCKYTILAKGQYDKYYDTQWKVSFSDGICRSNLGTIDGVLYKIILKIEQGEETRFITLAENVWGDGSGQNIPQ